MKFFLLFILVILTGSCVTDVEGIYLEQEKELTINCILNSSDDTVQTWVSYSKPIIGSSGFEEVKYPMVFLFEEDELIGQFSKGASTSLVLPYKVKTGKTYKIEASVNGETVWAECKVPELITAAIGSIENSYNSFDYNVSFKDNQKEDNQYWISAKGYSWYQGKTHLDIATSFYSNYNAADDFNRLPEQGYGYIYEYKYYIRISDRTLTTDLIELNFYPAGIQIVDGPQEIFVLSVDYHLDKYMKSSLLLEENDLNAEDVPIAYAPFPMYSNINGGTGIFGSYSSVSKVFSK